MSRAIIEHTQMAVVLSINIYQRTDDQEILRPLHLLTLTPLLFWLVTALLTMDRWFFVMIDWGRQFSVTIEVVSKLLAVGMSAFAFGLGVSR